MIYLYGFLFCGTVCAIAQIIYEKTKWTPGHITASFVVLGVFLDFFNFYDKIIEVCGAGASLPIISFGHSLMHGVFVESQKGFWGVAMGVFDYTSIGITLTIVLSILCAIIFKPKS